MDAWALSACYPRSTFYPLSDGPSTRDRRITLAYFRTCSTCLSRSQAPFYQCALRTIADPAEGTIARLRYIFGGDRPSQTTRLTLSQARIHGPWLGIQLHKGGIPRLAPRGLAPALRSLPPILYMSNRMTISGYSKGSRGLSVQLRVTGVFTGNSTSPSLGL